MAEDVRTSISSSYNLCLQSFDKLKRLLVEPECAFRDELSPEDLKDQEGRFRVWAGNSGAHRTGRVSLDYKLREASHVHAKVIDLLTDLNRSLQEAISIINHENRSDAGSSADSGSSDSSSSSDDGSSIVSGPSLPAETLPTTTELEYTLLDVMHVITCLYKFSIALRQPAPRDRLHKYAAISVSHFEFFDIGHAREKFPGAATYLVERLGKANMRRRQLLKYHRRHHDKIARYVDLPLAPDSPKPEMEVSGDEEVEAPPSRPTWGKVMTPEDFALHQPGPGTIATTMNTQTTVTTINPKFSPKNLDDIDAESETGQSQTSFASSSAGDTAKLKVPPPPGVDSLDGTPFECPYCFTMVIMRNSRSWMRHVMKDLKAYVCTFEHCAKPDQLFEYRHDWHEHEMQAHRREWVCEDCRKTFHTRSEIITHLRTVHDSLFTEKQLPVIADRCERVNTSDQPCPLCDVPALPPARLRSHIARHLQQLALFVLPRGGEVVDDNVQSVGAQVSEKSEDDHSSDDKDSKEDLEFDSNPSRENSEAGDGELQKQPKPALVEFEAPDSSAPVTNDRALYPMKYLHPHIETFFGDLPPPKNSELATLHAEAAELIKHDNLEPVATVYQKIPWPSDIESKREYISYFRAMAELLWKRELKDDAIQLLSEISAHNGIAEKPLAAELIAAGERCAAMLELTGNTSQADQRYRWIWDTLSALDPPWEKWVDIAEKLTVKSNPAVYVSSTNPRRALLLERNKLVYRQLLSEASSRFTLRHPERLSVMEKLAQQYEMCGEWAAAAKLSWRCLELRRDLLVTEVYETTKSDIAQTMVNLARQLRFKLDTYPGQPGDIVLPIYDSPDIADNFICLTELYCCLCQQRFLTTKELLKHEDVFHLHAERMKRPEAVEQGRDLMKSGQYQKTSTVIEVNSELIRSLEMEAYQLFEEDLGEGHPSTIDAMERRALSLRENNDEKSCREAINLLEKVLFKRQHIFRSDNPATLETLRNLTKTFEDLPLKAGPPRAAIMEDLYHKVLREHDTRFKATQYHRIVRDAIEEPATYFADDFRALYTHERIKERYFRDVLPQQVRALGWEHPDTLRNFEGLATALERGADHAVEIIESELTYRHVLAVRRQNLGWAHSDTLWSLACVIRMLAYKFVRLESIVDNPGEISTLYQELLHCCYISLGKAHFQTRRIQSEALVWLIERKEWREATSIQIDIIEAEYEQTKSYEMGEIQKLSTYMQHLVRTDSTELPAALIAGTKTIYIAYATDQSRGPHHPDALLTQKLRGVYFKRLGDFDSALDTFKMAYDGAVDAITVKQHSQRHRELREISHRIIKHIYLLKTSSTAEKWTAAFNHIIEAYPKMAAAFTPPTDVVDMAVEVGKLLYQERASQAVCYDWYRCCFEYFKAFFKREPTSKSFAVGKKAKVDRNITMELLASPTLSFRVVDDEYHPVVTKLVKRIILELDPHSNTPLHYWWAVQSSFGYDHPDAWEAFGKLETAIWDENSNNREKAMILYQYVKKLEPEHPTPETHEALNDLFTRTANIMSRHAYNTMSTNLWGRAFWFAYIIGPKTEWARMAAYRGRMADIAAETFNWYIGSTPANSSTQPSFTAEQIIKWYEEKVEILEEYGLSNPDLVQTVKRERIRTIANKVMFYCKRRQDPEECVEKFAAAFDTDRISTPADKLAIKVQDERISDLLAHGLPQYARAWCEWAARYLEAANNSVTYGYVERAGDIYLKGGNIIKAFTSYRLAYSRLSAVHDDEATEVAMIRVKLAHKLADVLQISQPTNKTWNKFGATETIPDHWYRKALDICETTPYIGVTHPTAIEVLFGLQGYCRQINKSSRAYEPTRKALNKVREDTSNSKSTALLHATLAREKAKIQVACKYFKKAVKCYQEALDVLENCPEVGSANEVTVQMLFEFAEFYESEENELRNWEEAKVLRQRIDEVAGSAGLEEEVVRGNRERMKQLVGLMIEGE